MSQYIPRPYERFGGDIDLKVDLSNCLRKADWKMQQELTHLNYLQNMI